MMMVHDLALAQPLQHNRISLHGEGQERVRASVLNPPIGPPVIA